MKKSSNGLATLRGSIIAGGMVFGIAMIGVMTIGAVLSSSMVMAEGDSAVDEVTITVPVTCSIGGVVDTAHTISMQAGTYSGVTGIGKTTLTTKCNDNNGFSIYAIGYTGDTDGTNTLVGASTNETINTGIYTTGANTSSWSMKVNKVTDATASYNPNNMTILNNYDNWHLVPTDYAKVAEYKAVTGSSATDTTLGAKIETTYDAYVSVTQTADSYEGKVKYVMVHPYNGDTPVKTEPFSWQAPTATRPDDAAIGTTMQDFDATMCSQGTAGQIGWLKDSRDGTVYTVGKLADGNCWMLDNLALDLTKVPDSYNGADKITLDATNTNATDTSLGYLKGTTTRDPSTDASGKYATAAVANWTTSYSYSAPLVNMSYKDTVPSDAPADGQGNNEIGGYYNYCAASAGSYCYGDGTSAGTSTGNATEDICPKGWRLPGGGSTVNLTATPPTGEYYNLYNGGFGYDTVTNYRNALSLPLSGYFNNGSPNDQGSVGRWWSSTRNGNGSMYSLSADTGYISPANSYNRYYGFSIRCVLGP